MSDDSLTLAVVQAADLRSLELLFDYTKFHIGVYLTLASTFITVASVKRSDNFFLELRRPFVWVAMACFLTAGLAGGVIVSSITQCLGNALSTIPYRCPSTDAFLKLTLGPWDLKWFTGRVWTQIEHTSFWLGLIFALCSFKQRSEPASDPTSKEPLAVKVEGSVQVRRGAA